MRNLFTLALFLLLASCASSAGDWGPWKMTDVSMEKRDWRFCRADKDGETYHRKGFCYQSQECRFKKTIFGNDKSECRALLLHCSWGDVECMDKYDIFSRSISPRN